MPNTSPTAGKAVTQPTHTLRRNLKAWHIQMIALGGAIGTGLFYGSSESIGLAGPSVLLTYAIGGFMIFLVSGRSAKCPSISRCPAPSVTTPTRIERLRRFRVRLELLVQLHRRLDGRARGGRLLRELLAAGDSDLGVRGVLPRAHHPQNLAGVRVFGEFGVLALH